MARLEKEKGKRGEREVVKLLKEAGSRQDGRHRFRQENLLRVIQTWNWTKDSRLR